MFKKIFNFGKKKQEELNENETIKQKEVIVEENEDKNKESFEDKIEKEQIKDSENSEISRTTEYIEEENLHNQSEKVYEDKFDLVKENIVRDEIEEEKIEQILNDENDEKVNESIENIEESKVNDQEVEIEEKDKDSEEEIVEVIEESQKKVNLFERLKQGLTKAKQGITDKIDDVLKSYTKVDEELLEELEEILITADVGVNTTMDIIDNLRDYIDESTKHVGDKDYKTVLQEKLQVHGDVSIKYNVIKELGPDHEKIFIVEVECDNKKLAEGMGKNKKQAEMDAAKNALKNM